MMWREKVDSATEAANHFFNGFRFPELGVNNITVLSPTNGHSKKRTPVVS